MLTGNPGNVIIPKYERRGKRNAYNGLKALSQSFSILSIIPITLNDSHYPHSSQMPE
jgi:hypothetical protein